MATAVCAENDRAVGGMRGEKALKAYPVKVVDGKVYVEVG